MKRLILGVVLALSGVPLKAEIFKCLDGTGNVTYSEKKESSSACVPVTATVNVVPAIKPIVPMPPIAPRLEQTDRRAELEKQIVAQEAALTEAKKALGDQENIRFGGEANYQRVLDRLQPYQDKVAEIEKNLAQLRAELVQLK